MNPISSASLNQIAKDVTVIGRAVAAKPEAPVPTCPGWDVRELALHLGAVHRWVERVVRTRATEPKWRDSFPDPAFPDPGEEEQWLREGAESMIDSLIEVGDEVDLWGWAGRGAGFWIRRQLHEASVHRVDADIALGVDPEIEASVALDGIAELMVMNLARSKRSAGDYPTEATLHLHATDAPEGTSAGEWTLSVDQHGLVVAPLHEKASAAIQGTASNILLVLYRRLGVDAVSCFGDDPARDAWLASLSL